VYQGAKNAVVWLIEQGASLNTRNFKRQNALHIAISYGKEEIALLLIEAGIETDVVDKEGNTPLAYAQQRGMSSVIRALGGEEKTPPTGGVMAKKKKQKATRTPSSTTTQGGEKLGGSSEIKDAQAFLKKKKKPREVGTQKAISMFLSDCRWGDLEAVKAYLTLGMDPNVAEPKGVGYGGETALIRTIEGDQRDIALMLMDAGADLEQTDGWGDTALRTAVNWQRWELLEEFLKRGANPNTINAQKTSALGWAKQRGFKKAIQLLEAYGAVDEVKASTGKKPAQKAVKKLAVKKNEMVLWSSLTAEVLPSQSIQQITDASALSGLRVYLGGVFNGQDAKRLQALLVARGATVTRRFTKNLQLCVFGNYTRRKKQQASQWLLPVWEEEHAKKMLGF
jgi:ankyrin repeat protein